MTTVHGGTPKQCLAVFLSYQDRVQNLRRPRWFEFTKLRGVSRREWESAPQIHRGFLLSFQLRGDNHMCVRKLPEARERTTRKEQAKKKKNSWNLHIAENSLYSYHPGWKDLLMHQASSRVLKIEVTLIFNNLTSEMAYHHFCCIFLVTQANPSKTWRGAMQDVNIRRQGSLGAISDWLPHWVSYSI